MADRHDQRADTGVCDRPCRPGERRRAGDHRDLFVASTTAVVVAATSAVATVVVAFRAGSARSDAKGALAWSTVGQMAIMVLQCAVGAFSSAVVHIAGHGMYKAARFLGVGGSVVAAVEQRRTTRPDDPLGPASTNLLAATAATVAVGVALVVVPPDLVAAGQVLTAVLAWATVLAAARGWANRCPTTRPVAVLLTIGAATAVVLVYFVGLRIVEALLKPDLGSVETAIGPATLIVLAVCVGVGVAVPLRRPGAPASVVADDVDRSELRSDVALAAAAVSPLWPLSSFVAVNPLAGLEPLGFDEATARARRWTGGRTHLSLDDFRADHDRGLTRLADLEYAVLHRRPEVCAHPASTIAGRLVDPIDVITSDLLDGPDLEPTGREQTRLERLGRHAAADAIDRFVAEHAARAVARPTGPFVAVAIAAANSDRAIRRNLEPAARSWLSSLGDDPVSVVAAAIDRLGTPRAERVDEFRRQLLRLPGWVGHARWRTDWAPRDTLTPAIAPIDLLAVRLALEAAAVWTAEAPMGAGTSPPDLLDRRVDAVTARLAPGRHPADIDAIRSVLAMVPAEERPAIWLAAQERAFDERLLTVLGRVDPGRSTTRPTAQVVCCIDVRSEGLRRHLEEVADVETLGFAGFFGLPVDVRRIAWSTAEPRCPVLVTPAMTVTEHVDPSSVQTVTRQVQRVRWRAATAAAHDSAKRSAGGPFALAEGLGWVTGPIAAWKTIRPPRSSPIAPRPTRMLLDDRTLIEQRIFAAESILRTMGLVERFAPLVALCGHTSRTENNPHATALDCGACGGASGEDSALAVAALLNAPDVRHGLAARGIEIPDDTWFLAAIHDTASDRVTVLDAELAPDGRARAVRELADVFERAGAANAADRARLLPGRPAAVRHRGADWAQIRPEWGLARAAAFVIAPRSLTAGLDLDGRAFLHGYDPVHDPDGTVLETIMTAPLIVAHWITSQYYFSTVDPEVFGAGDKMLHHPVGSVGVVSGDGRDLRIGLPLQSTHARGRRHHQPIRMLAVIQADLEVIERIIARHRILRTLVTGSWIRIAARSMPHEPWSIRTPAGTWITHPRPLDTVTTLAADEFVPTPTVTGGRHDRS
jgi:hypothetical protein